MKFELGASAPRQLEKKKDNLEIFRKAVEKKLSDLEKCGVLSIEESVERRKVAFSITEDQIRDDPEFLAEVIVSSIINNEKEISREEMVLDVTKYQEIANRLRGKHEAQLYTDWEDFIDGRRKEQTIMGSLHQIPRKY